jgi:hypothetical protein
MATSMQYLANCFHFPLLASNCWAPTTICILQLNKESEVLKTVRMMCLMNVLIYMK